MDDGLRIPSIDPGTRLSSHRATPGYKALLIAASVLTVGPVLALLPYFMDLPGTTPEARRESVVVALLCLAVFSLPGAFVVAFAVRSFRQTIHLYEHGLGVVRGDRETFVPWADVEKVELERTDTEFRAMLVVTVATSRDMKAKVSVRNGRPFRLNSGIAHVDAVLNALWQHRPEAFVAKR